MSKKLQSNETIIKNNLKNKLSETFWTYNEFRIIADIEEAKNITESNLDYRKELKNIELYWLEANRISKNQNKLNKKEFVKKLIKNNPDLAKLDLNNTKPKIKKRRVLILLLGLII